MWWLSSGARLVAALALWQHLPAPVQGAPYDAIYADYNINMNQQASSPLEYTTKRPSGKWTPSPRNWREIAFYTILPDKFADGDPANNDYFGTMFEADWRETQLRFGGDVKGMQNKLDYLQGMGIRGIFMSGTPFINMLWQADSYSPLDFSVLDPHYGTLAEWRDFIDEVHSRGMYFLADFTVGTMGDLIGFEGSLNTSARFTLEEHNAVWKKPKYYPWNFTTYKDFDIDNKLNTSCKLPKFWLEDSTVVDLEGTYNGCRESDFDQYGDMEAFGVHPDWQRQLSKFASVQDRLREWKPEVMDRLKVFVCMAIEQLDLDGIRLDKATQVTVDAIAEWSSSARNCAQRLGKNNFFIPGEVTGGNAFGALYFGRGRTTTMRPESFEKAVNLTAKDNQYFMREVGHNGLDSVAFHYSTYRVLTRILGMDGNLQVAFDLPMEFSAIWADMLYTNDFLTQGANGTFDPRHMYGTSNFDIFRWPSLESGIQKSAMANFITNLVLPGIPLYYYGEEQNFYIMDTSAQNYLYGRQAMMGNRAWQRHGCYRLGSEQYFHFPLEKALLGCKDDWNSLDHFDPTTDSRRMFKHMLYLREQYNVLLDGFGLHLLRANTYEIQLPGSNTTETEMGIWVLQRTILPGQRLTGNYTGDMLLVYMNENQTTTYKPSCNDKDKYIGTGSFRTGTTLQNLFSPYETYQVTAGATNDGCIATITMDPYGFKALVPVAAFIPPQPAITKFSPGHDARLFAESGDANATSVEVTLEFNTEMNCDSVTNSIKVDVWTSGHGSAPSISRNAVTCANMRNASAPTVQGGDFSVWSWKTTLTNVPDGIIMLTIDNPTSEAGAVRSGSKDHLLIRKGSRQNPMVNADLTYEKDAFAEKDGKYVFTHAAYGAEKFRYSWNFGTNWTTWKDWEDTTTIEKSQFKGDKYFWDGQHIMMQYWSSPVQSAAQVVHADLNYKMARTVPQFLARGPFNQFGFDKGINAVLEQTSDHIWEFEIMAQWPSYLQLNVFGFDDYYYGDVDNDGVLDRLAPNTAAPNWLNLTAPPKPHLAWNLVVNDSTLEWWLEPRGHSAVGATMYALLLVIPFITATLAVLIFMWSFYGVKYNKYGMKPAKEHTNYFPILGALGKSTADLKDGTSFSEKLFGGHKNADIIGWPEDKNKRRKVIIATLEYELIDWKLKVKIGGLGVMSSLMGKAMTDVDLLWVVPKVKDIEYPAGDPADPIEVIIFGEPYLIEVETHVLDNITYIILDSPVFRAQTKADPYPARMDDLSSAIFYSTWNQAIAATVRRYPDVDIYHVNDYHGALAPIYLLPKVLPVCLSLHNAEFQGLWPLRTKEEMKEVCSAFNISKEHCTKYVQFGNTFNLLHAAASFISQHQKSIGVAGVSDKYGKRSWARYPALWTLKHVDSLPNPDPTDIAALDEQPADVKHMNADQAAEAERPEHKRQAQEWAGLKQDPNADLFVFVGRWSKQKGVDLIADIMPSMLEKKTSIQLITVGPVIDLYGRFAAEKLARLMEMYPDRVFSKPEFTALPPYLFSGADFALIPSRDEPFGLVAVEFGRKGALGVGSRLGGLGLMPGWWFPVESTSTGHMLSQFSKTIKLALKSTEEERAVLRARSAVQRFPVIEWRQRTEDFHKRSIGISRGLAGPNAWRPSDGGERPIHAIGDDGDWNPVHQPEPTQPDWDGASVMSQSVRGPQTPGSPGQWSENTLTPNEHLSAPARVNPDARRGSFASENSDVEGDYFNSRESGDKRQEYGNFLDRANRTIARDNRSAPDPFMEGAAPNRPFGAHNRISSVESISSIVDEKSASPLNNVMATFTDADGGVAADFVQKLQSLDAENSKGDLCIEKFLMKSEETFFGQVKKEKLASSAASLRSSKRDSVWGTPAPSVYDYSSRPSSPSLAPGSASFGGTENKGPHPEDVPMTRLQIVMSRELGGWPLYTIVIAFGQMLSATSFQITLLSGQNWETDLQLYVLGAVFLAASGVWYTLFRYKPSIWVLAGPWIFFGIAFFLIGLPSLHSSLKPAREAMSSAATWSYAVASAAAFCFFGLNFGEEAGAATEVWMMRACIVQGSQQIWVAALWYWGHELNTVSEAVAAPWWIICIVWPLAAMSFLFCFLMIYGLPDYYRQTPPQVPGFLKTLFRRKLVLWFLAAELLRDYWLSGPYGRNWGFLWSVPIPKWQITLLVIAFFVVLWFLILQVLTYFSKTHTWLLAIFAVGLGAPRWCQMLWGTSSLALYIPWAGHAGPYLGLSLWLWLGVLDAVQGVGLGMILLQTLSRLHVCATLAFSQIIGSICVMVARATAPNRIGPESVFPDAAKWDFSEGLKGSPMASAPFWLALICQIIIVFGYFWFYRKEQLARP